MTLGSDRKSGVQLAGVGSTVLVIDDEKAIRDSLRMILEYEGFTIDEASSGIQALAKVAEAPPAVALLDVKMPDMDGLTVLEKLGERGAEFPVVVISGHGDIQTAIEATRLGAFDFLEKPLHRDRVLSSLKNALAGHRLVTEGPGEIITGPTLIGESPPIAQLRETIRRAAPTPATVLVTGESGTGKELIAHAIHQGSPRRDRAFVQVNCAAIPEELIESELFGHEKGSFTGAVRKQMGKFVAADGGTIFLDEIGDMSARTQAKVLRVLQSGEVEPVGAATNLLVDVRVIAATQRDLQAAIKDGSFREDLFYRLNVLPVHSPPLRERLEDVPLLIDHFVDQFAERDGYQRKAVSAEALELLGSLPWPGNVRELKNLVERLLVLGTSDTITKDAVLSCVSDEKLELSDALLGAPTLKEFRELSESLYLRHKLEENQWNVTQTAQSIGTPRSNLYKKMDHYGIKRGDEGK